MGSDRRDKKRRIEALRGLSLVDGCSTGELAALDRLGVEIDVRAGTVLTREGRRANECFVVFDGAAAVHRAGTPVGSVAAGSVAGEMALLDGTCRSATVVASTPMRLLVLSANEFGDLLEVSPSIDARLHRLAAERRAALQQSAGQRLVGDAAG